MKSFKKFLNIVLSLAILVGGISLANAQPLFVQPVQEQTGFYAIHTIESNGNLTYFTRSGSVLEVIPGGETIFGTTIPDGNVLLWGNVNFPDLVIYYQSPISVVVPYSHSYPVVAGVLELINGEYQVVLLGEGEMVFDPNFAGSGSTIDLRLHVTSPFVAHGEQYVAGQNVNFRLTRHVTSIHLQACDRSTIVDFSPRPPVTQCD